MKKVTAFSIVCALVGLSSAPSRAEEALPELAKTILVKFPKADQNGDGKLTGREWVIVQKGILRKHPGADIDSDGSLSQAEQAKLVKKLGTPSSSATPAQLAKFLK